MREILFRGKCNEIGKYNGQWIEGFYAVDDEKPIIGWSTDHGVVGYFCEPESIGQYTGLTDKNGRKIFEGDIVRLFDISVGEIVQECGAFGIGCRKQIDYDYLASEIAPVTGNNNTPMFCYNDNFVSLWELWWNYNEESDEISVIEVIGNIHDNPELFGNSEQLEAIK